MARLRGGRWVIAAPQRKERKVFFFEKKNQKTFATDERSLTQALERDSWRH
jgi:hypothetical protein